MHSAGWATFVAAAGSFISIGRIFIVLDGARQIVANCRLRPFHKPAPLEDNGSSCCTFAFELARTDDFFPSLRSLDLRALELVCGQLECKHPVAVAQLDRDDTLSCASDELGFFDREGEGPTRFRCNAHVFCCVRDIDGDHGIVIAGWPHVPSTVLGRDLGV